MGESKSFTAIFFLDTVINTAVREAWKDAFTGASSVSLGSKRCLCGGWISKQCLKEAEDIAYNARA